MLQNDFQDWQAKMMDALLHKHGVRESSSITAYYFDAKSDISLSQMEYDIEQLQKGVPVQYVTNTVFFYGHRFHVDDRILIPRPETEELVHWVIQDFKSETRPLKLLDIGTGSGCILLSLLLKLDNVKGTALDIDSSALEIARLNAKNFGLDITTIQIDILNYKSKGETDKFDIIVCNPPYILKIEKDRMDPHVLEFEPEIALFVDGDDPLVFYKKVIDLANDILPSGGTLYFETSDRYHEEFSALSNQEGWDAEFRKDMQNKWRMLKLIKN